MDRLMTFVSETYLFFGFEASLDLNVLAFIIYWSCSAVQV